MLNYLRLHTETCVTRRRLVTSGTMNSFLKCQANISIAESTSKLGYKEDIDRHTSLETRKGWLESMEIGRKGDGLARLSHMCFTAKRTTALKCT